MAPKKSHFTDQPPSSKDACTNASHDPSDKLSQLRKLLDDAMTTATMRQTRILLEQALSIAEGRPVEEIWAQLRELGGTPPEILEVTESPGPTHNEVLAVELYPRLAKVFERLGAKDKVTLAYRGAVERASELGPSTTLAKVLGAHAVALGEAYKSEQAETTIDALWSVCEALAAVQHPDEAPARVQLARAVLLLGRIDEAATIAKTATECAGSTAPTVFDAVIEASIIAAWAFILVGRVTEARKHAESALEAAQQRGSEDLIDEATAVAGLAQALAGDTTSGIAKISKAQKNATSRHQPQLQQQAQLAHSIATLRAGEWQTAKALAQAATHGRSPAPSLFRVLPWLFGAEACYVGARIQSSKPGETTQVAGLLREGQRLIQAAMTPALRLEALAPRARRVAAVLDAEQGLLQATEALATLEETLEEADKFAGPLETAHCLLALGDLGKRVLGNDPRTFYSEAEELTKDAGVEGLQAQSHLLAKPAEQPETVKTQTAGTRKLALVLEVSRAISTILDLDQLLERIMDAIIELLNAERGFVMLYDEPRSLEDASDGADSKLRVRVARHMSQESIESPEEEVSRSVVEDVLNTGKPCVVTNALNDKRFSNKSSVMLLNLRSVLCFPLQTKAKSYGVLYVENRSTAQLFGEHHVEAMLPFTSQAALAIENAFAYSRIQELYEETLSVARARERILNHVSHELKTPIAIVSGTLRILGKRLASDPKAEKGLKRATRNIQRLVDIQRRMLDIYEASASGSNADTLYEPVSLQELVEDTVALARQEAPDRKVNINVRICPDSVVHVSRYPLEMSVEALLRNAIENTPDDGVIEIETKPWEADRLTLIVRDFGVGITKENQKHIFEGFFHTQDTERYSSRRPYQFDAGGKGLDLLSIKTYADKFGWAMEVESERCSSIPTDDDVCPGEISLCSRCLDHKTCLANGGSEFRLSLPIVPPSPPDG